MVLNGKSRDIIFKPSSPYFKSSSLQYHQCHLIYRLLETRSVRLSCVCASPRLPSDPAVSAAAPPAPAPVVTGSPPLQIGGGAPDDGDLGTGSASGYQQAPSAAAVPTRVTLRGHGGGDNL